MPFIQQESMTSIKPLHKVVQRCYPVVFFPYHRTSTVIIHDDHRSSSETLRPLPSPWAHLRASATSTPDPHQVGPHGKRTSLWHDPDFLSMLTFTFVGSSSLAASPETCTMCVATAATCLTSHIPTICHVQRGREDRRPMHFLPSTTFAFLFRNTFLSPPG